MGSNAKLVLPKEALQWSLLKFWYYSKLIVLKRKKITTIKSQIIERYLALIWNNIKYIEHGRRIAMAEGQFVRETITKDIFMTLKTAEIILLPTCLGRWTVKLKVEEIPVGIGVIRVGVAIVYYGMNYPSNAKRPRTGISSSLKWLYKPPQKYMRGWPTEVL